MNPLDKFLLFVALPAVVIASGIEAIVLSQRRAYDWRAAGVSLLDLAMRISVQIFLPLSIATPFIVWAVQHRLTTIALERAPAPLNGKRQQWRPRRVPGGRPCRAKRPVVKVTRSGAALIDRSDTPAQPLPSTRSSACESQCDRTSNSILPNRSRQAASLRIE